MLCVHKIELITVTLYEEMQLSDKSINIQGLSLCLGRLKFPYFLLMNNMLQIILPYFYFNTIRKYPFL